MVRTSLSDFARPGALAAIVFLLLAGPGRPDQDGLHIREASDLRYIFGGIGYDDFNDKSSPAAGFLIELAGGSLFSFESAPPGDTLLRLRPRAAVEFSSDDNIFAGVGLSLELFPFGGPLFAEASFLPGTYYGDDGDYFPIQFRSQVGAGWQFGNGHQIALVVNHKSNNDWGPEGSSVETVLLRYGVPF